MATRIIIIIIIIIININAQGNVNTLYERRGINTTVLPAER